MAIELVEFNHLKLWVAIVIHPSVIITNERINTNRNKEIEEKE
mgnify:FL=1